MSPERPGTLNLHLNPDKVDAIKALCSEKGTNLNEVLEGLIDHYVQSNATTKSGLNELTAGSSINTRRSTVEEIFDRLEQVEGYNHEFVSAFEILIHRVESLEKKVGGVDEEPRHRPHVA